ncbi:hypothetical protein BGX38DRAFT_161190 [Terfezia claveryi]|nr:hypothetical protein BGX38DRAFT_161190 [Terfezia claveryi]
MPTSKTHSQPRPATPIIQSQQRVSSTVSEGIRSRSTAQLPLSILISPHSTGSIPGTAFHSTLALNLSRGKSPNGAVQISMPGMASHSILELNPRRRKFGLVKTGIRHPALCRGVSLGNLQPLT